MEGQSRYTLGSGVNAKAIDRKIYVLNGLVQRLKSNTPPPYPTFSIKPTQHSISHRSINSTPHPHPKRPPRFLTDYDYGLSSRRPRLRQDSSAGDLYTPRTRSGKTRACMRRWSCRGWRRSRICLGSIELRVGRRRRVGVCWGGSGWGLLGMGGVLS